MNGPTMMDINAIYTIHLMTVKTPTSESIIVLATSLSSPFGFIEMRREYLIIDFVLITE
jgi:hypothetical protein